VAPMVTRINTQLLPILRNIIRLSKTDEGRRSRSPAVECLGVDAAAFGEDAPPQGNVEAELVR